MAGNATERGGVYLSLTHIPPEVIEKRLPSMFANIKSVGIDIRTEPFEITPAAHYTDGGVVVNVMFESEDIPGLYAVGETAGGIHGGNRLGSNSLPDLMVTGIRAGQAASIRATRLKKAGMVAKVPQDQVKEEMQRVFAPLERGDGISPLELRDRHLDLMWKYVSVIRDGKGLGQAVAEMDAMWSQELPKVRVSDGSKTWNYEWLEALDLYPRLFMSQAMALSALLRTESRANHYREDYPDTDNKNWLKNIEVTYDPSASSLSKMIKTTARPVRVTLLTPEEAGLPGLAD
jgi:succinate dehydrogenase/fumarate reductase flavoprotein subunit